MTALAERPAAPTEVPPPAAPRRRLAPAALAVVAAAGLAVLVLAPNPTAVVLAVAAVAAAVGELTRRLRAQLAAAAELEVQRRDLLTLGQSTAEELEVATRMMRARAQTMTSVIDAVTEQSIIGTDRDGLIRVWNPGAERMLGLPRAEVVRLRTITDFHAPEELSPDDAPEPDPGARFATLVHGAKEHGSDVRDWTYLTADGRRLTVSVAITPRTDDDGEQAGWNFVGTDKIGRAHV